MSAAMPVVTRNELSPGLEEVSIDTGVPLEFRVFKAPDGTGNFVMCDTMTLITDSQKIIAERPGGGATIDEWCAEVLPSAAEVVFRETNAPLPGQFVDKCRDLLLHVPNMLPYWVEKLHASGYRGPLYEELCGFIFNSDSFLASAKDTVLRVMEYRCSHAKWEEGMVTCESMKELSKRPINDQAAAISRILERIDRETDYFGPYRHLGLQERIIQGVSGGSYGRGISFLAKIPPFPYLRNKLGLGGLTVPHLFGWIGVTLPRPKPVDFAESLLFTGKLPQAISTIAHEEVHREQFRGVPLSYLRPFAGMKLVSWASAIYGWMMVAPLIVSPNVWMAVPAVLCLFYMGIRHRGFLQNIASFLYPVPCTAAAELQPREAEASSGLGNPSPDSTMLEELAVMKLYPSATKDMKRLTKLLKDIHTLRLLGVGDKEITRTLQTCYYHPFKKCYPKLEDRLRKEFAAAGVTTPEQQDILYHALECEFQLKRRHDQMKASLIAWEELAGTDASVAADN